MTLVQIMALCLRLPGIPPWACDGHSCEPTFCLVHPPNIALQNVHKRWITLRAAHPDLPLNLGMGIPQDRCAQSGVHFVLKHFATLSVKHLRAVVAGSGESSA